MGSGQAATIHGTLDAKKESTGYDPLGARGSGALVHQGGDQRYDAFTGRDSWPGEHGLEMTHRTQQSIRVPTRGIVQDNQPRIRGLSVGQATVRDETPEPAGSPRTQ